MPHTSANVDGALQDIDAWLGRTYPIDRTQRLGQRGRRCLVTTTFSVL